MQMAHSPPWCGTDQSAPLASPSKRGGVARHLLVFAGAHLRGLNIVKVVTLKYSDNTTFGFGE
jgi:hypothetical protein